MSGRGSLIGERSCCARRAHPARACAREDDEDGEAARSVSDVGYMTMAKRRLSWTLGNPEAWNVEIGRPEDSARLEREAAVVQRSHGLRQNLSLTANIQIYACISEQVAVSAFA